MVLSGLSLQILSPSVNLLGVLEAFSREKQQHKKKHMLKVNH